MKVCRYSAVPPGTRNKATHCQAIWASNFAKSPPGPPGSGLVFNSFLWFEDEILEESENLLDPNVLATDIVEDLDCGTRTIPPNRR